MACDGDMTSEREVIERLEREGFTEHFVVKDGALRSGAGTRFAPADVTIRAFGRYEAVLFLEMLRDEGFDCSPEVIPGSASGSGTPPRIRSLPPLRRPVGA